MATQCLLSSQLPCCPVPSCLFLYRFNTKASFGVSVGRIKYNDDDQRSISFQSTCVQRDVRSKTHCFSRLDTCKNRIPVDSIDSQIQPLLGMHLFIYEMTNLCICLLLDICLFILPNIQSLSAKYLLMSKLEKNCYLFSSQ